MRIARRKTLNTGSTFDDFTLMSYIIYGAIFYS